MATVSQMARMQSYQNQYGLGNKNSSFSSNFGSNSVSDAEQARIDKGQEEFRQHMADLEASGYLMKDNSYKVIIPISGEVKAEVETYVKDMFENNGGWYTDGSQSIGDISFAYTETLDPADRLSASWSVNQYYNDLGSQYKAKINETNPNWPYDGSSYDPSIFDGWSPSTLNVTA